LAAKQVGRAASGFCQGSDRANPLDPEDEAPVGFGTAEGGGNELAR